jgi:hypothetical protein
MRGMESYPNAAMGRAMKVQDVPTFHRPDGGWLTKTVLLMAPKSGHFNLLADRKGCVVEESTWCRRVRLRHIF